MKFLKNGIVIFLSCILALGLFSCGGNGGVGNINYNAQLTPEQEIEKYGDDVVYTVDERFNKWTEEEKQKQWEDAVSQISDNMESIKKMEAEIDNNEEYKESFKKYKSLMENTKKVLDGEYSSVKLRNLMLETAALMKEVGNDFIAFMSGF